MGRSVKTIMDQEAAWRALDSQRRHLADLLDDLGDDEWEHPSLCAQWRVRDVAAHLALAHMGPVRAAVELARAGGRFDVMVRDTAVRHASTPRQQLTDEIRAMIGSRRLAPGVSYLEPLLDVLVHGQDIAVPLQRRHTMPTDAAAAAAQRVWTLPWPLSMAFPARSRLRGIELVATDVDWSAGRGLRVEGPVDALLLLLTGRTASLDRLFGPGVPQLRGSR